MGCKEYSIGEQKYSQLEICVQEVTKVLEYMCNERMARRELILCSMTLLRVFYCLKGKFLTLSVSVVMMTHLRREEEI